MYRVLRKVFGRVSPSQALPRRFFGGVSPSQALPVTVAFHALACAAAALFVGPLLLVLAASLQPSGQALRAEAWLPQAPSWANYERIFEVAPLARYTVNSLLVAVVAVPATIVVASLAGFAMAQLPRRERYLLLALAIALRMVPVTALWLTRYVLFTQLRLIDTVWPLLAPVWMGSSPLFVLLFYWSFRRTPQALFEAARVDGLGAFGIWAHVALPLARPAIMAVAVLTFVQYWSDFINPLLYLKSDTRYTLAVGLRIMQQMDITGGPLLMAAAVVMTVPVLVVFLLAQRAFWPEARLGGVYGR
jgi:multiple sugar transport system permease protein